MDSNHGRKREIIMTRIDGRTANEMRKVKIKTGYLKFAGGSCLIEVGNTKVLCSATMEDKVPSFLKGSAKPKGWLSAEYGMLPASCTNRIARDRGGKINGRTQEIQRLIGRSLRAVVDLEALGERTVWIDCDVIQGDGGTRTASITGGIIALAELNKKLLKSGCITKSILKNYMAAVSVGIVKGVPVLDLCYEEDSNAEVDMNVVMIDTGCFVEVQGTAENEPFSKQTMNKLLELAHGGIQSLMQLQKKYMSL
jgi:ribonuclease PH